MPRTPAIERETLTCECIPYTTNFRMNGGGQQPFGGPQQTGNGRRFASRFGPPPSQMPPSMGMGMGMGMRSGGFQGMMTGPPMPPRAPPPPPPPPPPLSTGPRVAEDFLVPSKVACRVMPYYRRFCCT